MPHKFLWRAVLVAVLSVALAAPAAAESYKAAGTQIVIGIAVVSAAIAVLVTVLVIHHKNKKSTITGCVNTGANGTIVMDEVDKRTYKLAGEPAGVKQGNRMTLEGKRRKGTTSLRHKR